MFEDELIRSPVFAGIPAGVLQRAAASFTRRTLDAGQMLWLEEQPATELAIVVTGALRVQAGVQVISEIGPGELIGEAGVFSDERRSASVGAVSPAILWTLRRSDLALLAETLPEVQARLLDRALAEMARRVRALDLKIAGLAEPTDLSPTYRAPSRFLRALRRLGQASDESPTPVYPALRRLPGLKEASPTVIAAIARAMIPRTVEADVAVFLEGEEGRSAFVLAEGSVRVLRAVRGGRTRRLAELDAGSLFGTGSLISGDRRSASVLTSTDKVRLFEIDQTAMSGLTGEAGRAWRMALFHALRAQLLGASEHLADLKGGTSASDRHRIRRAAQTLVGYLEPPPEPRAESEADEDFAD